MIFNFFFIGWSLIAEFGQKEHVVLDISWVRFKVVMVYGVSCGSSQGIEKEAKVLSMTHGRGEYKNRKTEPKPH